MSKLVHQHTDQNCGTKIINNYREIAKIRRSVTLFRNVVQWVLKRLSRERVGRVPITILFIKHVPVSCRRLKVFIIFSERHRKSFQTLETKVALQMEVQKLNRVGATAEDGGQTVLRKLYWRGIYSHRRTGGRKP